jgi:hypothetical protein
MNVDIKDLIWNFDGKTFEDFIAHVYSTFQKKIDSSNKKQDKNKYIKIRQSILQYVVANKKIVTTEIKNKNYK